jgi:hypothetical protein
VERGLDPAPGAATKSWSDYNLSMARGWESKGVEAQQAEASDKSSKPRVRVSAKEAARTREQENLRLARNRVLQQIETVSNSQHRSLLQKALDDLEGKLRNFDG